MDSKLWIVAHSAVALPTLKKSQIARLGRPCGLWYCCGIRIGVTPEQGFRSMAVSKEVQDVLDKARAAQTLRVSTAQAMNALQQQNADQKAKIDALTAQLAAIPAGSVLSADDKAALLEAGQDLVDGNADTSALIKDAHAAIPANIVPSNGLSATAASPAGPLPAIGDVIHTPEQLAANGPANAPAGGQAPLMPNLAFDPGAGSATQPTAGGFIAPGAGGPAIAAGASAASPSSSVGVAAVDAGAAPAVSGQASAASPPSPVPGDPNVQNAAVDQAAIDKAKADQAAAAAKDGEPVQQPS